MPFRSKDDVIYAAGLYEGEGTIGSCIHPGNNKSIMYSLRLKMTDREPLERFQKAFPYARIQGPYEHKNAKKTWKPFYNCAVCGFNNVVLTIGALWPWLSTRRQQQAKKALRYYHAF